MGAYLVRLLFPLLFLIFYGCHSSNDTSNTANYEENLTVLNSVDSDNDGVIDKDEPFVGLTVGVADGIYNMDILSKYEWHLDMINVKNVWKYFTIGEKNITITLLDTGVDLNHPDLEIDLNKSFRYSDYTHNPSLTSSQLSSSEYNAHGTADSGIIAAKGWNKTGVIGVAPNINIAMLNVFSNPTDDTFYNALANLNTDISSNSWGGGSNYFLFSDPYSNKGIEEGIKNGRDKKGIIYVFAGGNEEANANFQDILTTGWTIPVAAVNDDYTHAYYSNYGSNILISAPGGGTDIDNKPEIVTTDLTGLLYGIDTRSNHWDVKGNENGDYTNLMDGTSAATPMVSAVVGLMLSINNSLTYRDVQYILAITANNNFGNDWSYNSAGLKISDKFGFGIVNAYKAVEMAKNFNGLGSEINETEEFIFSSYQNSNTSTWMADIDNNFTIEKVMVIISTDYEHCGKLNIRIKSPGGTISTLAYGDTVLYDKFNNWRFLSFQFLNETSAGTWELSVTNNYENRVVDVNASIIIKGHYE